MKAVILHGTDADHTHNWFPWLKNELERAGYEVWVPDLPSANQPSMDNYLPFLLSRGWDFQNNLIVGHSSGAVTILGLLQSLNYDVKVNTAILVGAFTVGLSKNPQWHMLKDLFNKPFNYAVIRQKAKQFIFVHSADDPYCPIDEARWLCEQVGGKFIELPGSKHFSYKLDHRFKKFPQLLEIIKANVK